MVKKVSIPKNLISMKSDDGRNLRSRRATSLVADKVCYFEINVDLKIAHLSVIEIWWNVTTSQKL